jgi:hypothetical protein
MLSRRTLLTGLATAAGGALLTSRVTDAAPARPFAESEHDYPIRMRSKVEVLFQSPDGHGNGLEATQDGLWVGEQISDRAHLLEWETGKVLASYETQSSNTSGIAAGGGYLWMAANGPASRRDTRPHDVEQGGRIVKMDLKTGKHIKNYTTPNGGGLHGLTWMQDSLWITQFGPNKILRSDADLNVTDSFPVPLSRAHGLGWDGHHLWCMFSNDFRVLKFDVTTGRVVEAIQLNSDDADPHGMTWHDGYLYYCDAGIAPGAADNQSKYAGSICRIHT